MKLWSFENELKMFWFVQPQGNYNFFCHWPKKKWCQGNMNLTAIKPVEIGAIRVSLDLAPEPVWLNKEPFSGSMLGLNWDLLVFI